MKTKLMQKVASKIQEQQAREHMLVTGEGLLTDALSYKIAEAQVVSGMVETTKQDAPEGTDGTSLQENGEGFDRSQGGAETGKPVIAAAGTQLSNEASGTESLSRDLSHDKQAAAVLDFAKLVLQHKQAGLWDRLASFVPDRSEMEAAKPAYPAGVPSPVRSKPAGYTPKNPFVAKLLQFAKHPLKRPQEAPLPAMAARMAEEAPPSDEQPPAPAPAPKAEKPAEKKSEKEGSDNRSRLAALLRRGI